MTKTQKKPRARVELYPASDGWRFRAIAANGRKIGMAEEGIKQAAYQAKRAHRQFPDLPIIIVDAEGNWEFYA